MAASAIAVRERGITFTAPNVLAVNDGRKTMSRRIAKWKMRPGQEKLNLGASSLHSGLYFTGLKTSGWVLRSMDASCWNDRTFPNKTYLPGDLLYVREAWRAPKEFDEYSPAKIGEMAPEANYRRPWCPTLYEADGLERDLVEYDTEWGRYRNARFMPKWAARTWLEVTDVRVERLSDITEEDAKAEGVDTPWTREKYPNFIDNMPYKAAFSALWNKIHGEGSWQENPWVFAVSFRKNRKAGEC